MLYVMRDADPSRAYPSTDDMDPDLRNALLLIGLLFCGFFAVVTVYVIVDTGLRLRTYGDIGAIGLYAVLAADRRDDRRRPDRRAQEPAR